MAKAAAARKDDDQKSHWLPLTAMLLGGIGAARHIEGPSSRADGKPVTFEQVDPRTIKADPATFQFKSGGDASGVTDRMAGVNKWDQIAAGKAIVWERGDGERFVADGHQRRGLALRAIEAGQKNVALDAYVMKERDGWTSKDVRAYAALKNMKELSGSAVDFAKVVRERPDLIDGSLPMSDGKVRQAMALSKLSDPAFDMVVSGGVKPEHAATVGEQVKDPARHVGMLTEMAKAGMGSEQHARLYVQQALAAPEFHETTGSLFGTETNVRSLLAERAKVLDKAMSALKTDKRIFGLLEREAGTIEAAGNKLSHETNAAKAEGAGRQAELIEKLATSRGPVSAMLDKAAKALAEGQSPSQAARSFVREVGDTMQTGGIHALMGTEPPKAAEPVDPNQSQMFGPEAKDVAKTTKPDASQAGMFGEPTTADKIAAEVRAKEAKGRVGDPANEGLFGSGMKQTDLVEQAKVKPAPSGGRPGWSDAARTASADVRKADAKPVRLANSKVGWDHAGEAAKVGSMSDAELAQTERTNKARVTPNMAARHKLATEEIARRAEAKPAVISPVKTGETTDSALRSRIETLAKTNPEISKAIESMKSPGAGKIMGHDWEDIQRAQAGGSLNKRIDLSKPSKAPPSAEDMRLLEQHGSVKALEAAGLYGVADRVKDVSLNRPEGAKPAPQVTPAKGADATPRGKADVLKAAEVNFAEIKRRIGNSLTMHQWDVDNGGKVTARVKTTMKGGGEIKTAYLHLSIEMPDGSKVAYRETAKGTFKETGFQPSPTKTKPASPPSSGDLTGGSKETAGSVKQSSGLHGTQNPENARVIAANRKANAKPKAEKAPKAPKAEAQAIVIARAEMTGLQPTGKQTRFDGVNYRPEFKPAPEAKAAMWTNNGGPEELAKAQAHAEKEGWKVFTYPTSEKDPLGKAKAAALEAHAKETAPKPAEKPARKPRAPKAAPAATPAPVLAPVKPVEAAKAKPKGYVTLGDGRKMPIDKYTEAWKKAKSVPANTPVRGTPSDPLGGGTAGDVVRELRSGLQDRINRKDPAYGKGRKWDDSWQSDARRLKDTLGTRSEVRPGEAHPVDLRPRIAHRLAEGTQLPPVGGTKKPVRPAKVAAPQAAAPAPAVRRGSPPQVAPMKGMTPLGWSDAARAKSIEVRQAAAAPKADPTPTLAAQGVQRGKPAANPVVPAPKAAEPVKAPKAKGGKALGVGLGVAAVGVAALVAANKAKAEGAGATGQLKEAATEGAKATGEMAAWTVGMGAATTGLVRAGMTLAKAVPLVGAGLMAGGALKGAWDARHDGAKAMATGAAKGAWDMSLPGMVVNTGIAAKDAIQTRMATPSTSPSNFAAAQERFSAMKAAAKASEAGEKKKGWSNAARIGAYKAREAKRGNPATNLPYGGALTPPAPLK